MQPPRATLAPVEKTRIAHATSDPSLHMQQPNTRAHGVASNPLLHLQQPNTRGQEETHAETLIW